MHVCPGQAFGGQGSEDMLQVVPVHPLGQEQVKDPTVLVHVPPFKQGEFVHSLTSISQCVPTQLGVHEHANPAQPVNVIT